MNILSLSFIFTFVVVFAVYWILPKKSNVQNIFLLGINYALYATWDLKMMWLLLVVSLTSFVSGFVMNGRCKMVRKSILVTNLLINVGTLFLFKYYNFFASELCEALNISNDKVLLNLLLPVGISFYVFTTTGYVIDIYRNTRPAERNVVNYLSFISFFPLILSGPIERSTTLLPQFAKKREFSYNLAVAGVQQVAWGFFKKLVIADNCAMVVSRAFENYEVLPASSLIIGAILYSFQIYFDFSGYSDIAIGLSKLLGFRVRRNFNFPYISVNISDFWRRWHISLQQWFTDYIYFPLGGSRCSKARAILNTIIVFLVCGLWHGANWTFVVWGLYNGLLFVPYIIFFKGRVKKTIDASTLYPSWTDMLHITITFISVTIGWVIFNSPSITDALFYLSSCCSTSMFTSPMGIGLADFGLISVLLFATLVLEWFNKDKEFALLFKSPGWVKAGIIYSIIILMIFCKAGASDFIYVQF